MRGFRARARQRQILKFQFCKNKVSNTKQCPEYSCEKCSAETFDVKSFLGIGVSIKLRVGNVEKTFTMTSSIPEAFRFVFGVIKSADTVEIIPPKPTSALELSDTNQDTRKLVVELIYFKLVKLIIFARFDKELYLLQNIIIIMGASLAIG